MEPDKMMTYPTYIKRMNNQEFYDMEPWSSVEYQSQINGSFTSSEPVIKSFSDKDYIYLELNGFDCFIGKKRYEILLDNDLHKNFCSIVKYSDVVIDRRTGDILKFVFVKQLQAMLPMVLNIVNIDEK